MTHNIYIYIGIMIGVTYLIRVIPMTLLRKQIKNEFLTSFLYYVPYVTLAVMTFPDIVEATQSPIAGLLAFGAGTFAAWRGANMFQVAIICCLVVLGVEMVL
ncbi:MAG: AzlD domain-containing protein [Bacteroidia bacterium]|nr:AzlD domain-containing protein [Bacteroidia bacterium]